MRELRSIVSRQAPDDHRALVLIDLDHFKSVNDRWGHEVGDQLLRHAATSMRQALQATDLLARLGGEEFAIVLDRASPRALVRDAERLRECVARPITIGSAAPLAVTASAGLVFLRPGLTEEGLLYRADAAAYEAKAGGRARLVHFELVPDGEDDGADADLRRFADITRLQAERMHRMVEDMGRQLVEGARRRAMKDALTGIHNRGYFNERLPRDLDRARTSGRPLVMALLDVDHFHDINAAHGWPTGDLVLQGVVRLVASHIRQADWLARYGGEEFAVVLPDTTLDQARDVMERVRAAVQQARFTALDGADVRVTVSIGLAEAEDGMSGPVALVDVASHACLAAKAQGRNRVSVPASPRSARPL